MSSDVGTVLPQPRYSYGGDEYVFVELAEAMSLKVNFRAMAITNRVREENISGVTDICPSNASYMIRINPDELHPDDLISRLKEIDEEVGHVRGFELPTRVVDVPVMMEDPWTHEALMRFRDRHQDPHATDLEYSARINGYESKDDFIAALLGSPWLVTMIGFVPGLPWCYQLVPPEEQVEVPKYVRPRTYTPERAFGFGGGFAVIYSVQGAGGYQLYGLAPAPVLDVDQRLSDFRDSIVFPKPGDVFNFRGIDREEFDEVRARVEGGDLRVPHPRIYLPPGPLAGGSARLQRGDPGGALWRLGSTTRASSPRFRTRVASESTPSGCRRPGRWTFSPTRSATTSSATKGARPG